MKSYSHGVPMLALAAAIASENAFALIANDDLVDAPAGDGQQVTATIDVLANDVSDYGGELQVVAEGAVITQQGGTASWNGRLFEYVPPADFVGQDSFSYSIEELVDGSPVGFDQANVQINVQEITSGGTGAIIDIIESESGKETAEMIINVCESESSDISPEIKASCSALSELSLEEQVEAVIEITPEEVLMQRRMMSEQTRGQTSRVYSAQSFIRQGINPSFIVLNNQVVPLQNYEGGAASSEQTTPWSLFGSVHIDEVEHDRSDKEAGYESSSYGVTAGLDYRLNSAMHVGAALDWTTYEVDFDVNSNVVESDFINLTGYFSWFFNEFTWDVQVGYAFGEMDIKRNFVTLSDLSTITANTDSDQYSLSTQIDWTYSTGPWTTRPYLRLDYLTTTVDGYTEKGDNPWAMEVGDQDLDQITTSLGADVSYAWSTSWGVFVPSFTLSLVSESASDYDPVTFKLAGDSGTTSLLELQPDSEDELFYQYDLGAVFVMKNGVSSFFSVQFISGYENLSAYHISGGVNFEL